MEPADIVFVKNFFNITNPSYCFKFSNTNGYALYLENFHNFKNKFDINEDRFIWYLEYQHSVKDIFKLCLLIIALLEKKDKYLNLIFYSFLNDQFALNRLSFYKSFSELQIEFLFKMLKNIKFDYKIIIGCYENWLYIPEITHDLYGFDIDVRFWKYNTTNECYNFK